MPARKGGIPATPLAVPPAKLFKVIGMANFITKPSDAERARGEISSPSFQDRSSSQANHPNTIPAPRGAKIGAKAPKKAPNPAETNAPRALKREMIAFVFLERGELAKATLMPTAKLSVEEERARRKARRMVESSRLKMVMVWGGGGGGKKKRGGGGVGKRREKDREKGELCTQFYKRTGLEGWNPRRWGILE